MYEIGTAILFIAVQTLKGSCGTRTTNINNIISTGFYRCYYKNTDIEIPIVYFSHGTAKFKEIYDILPLSHKKPHSIFVGYKEGITSMHTYLKILKKKKMTNQVGCVICIGSKIKMRIPSPYIIFNITKIYENGTSLCYKTLGNKGVAYKLHTEKNTIMFGVRTQYKNEKDICEIDLYYNDIKDYIFKECYIRVNEYYGYVYMLVKMMRKSYRWTGRSIYKGCFDM